MVQARRIAVPLSHDTVALLSFQGSDFATLKIITASTYDDPGGASPAESVTLTNEGVIALRNLLTIEIKDPT